MAAGTAADTFATLNQELPYWEIHILFDDAEQGASGSGGYATEDDAVAWASDYNLPFPVLAERPAYMASVRYQLGLATPIFFILDPDFKIVEMVEGWAGEAYMQDQVRWYYNRWLGQQ